MGMTYGLGDEGKLGIQGFVEQHSCNAICRALNLTPVDEIWSEMMEREDEEFLSAADAASQRESQARSKSPQPGSGSLVDYPSDPKSPSNNS
jgi:hypothetical protein